MRYLLAIHRCVMVLVGVVILWVVFTGTMVQFFDNRAILTNAPATDMNLVGLRESFNGPPNYEVLTATEYMAQDLPAGADLKAMLATVTAAARVAAPDKPVRYVELRVVDGKPVGVVATKPLDADARAKAELIRLDAADGSVLSRGPPLRDPPNRSGRNTFKGLHGMGFLGSPWGNILDELAGLGLLVLATTGLLAYFKVRKVRPKAVRSKWFWKAGGWWRTFHRGIALVSAVFVVMVVVSGMANAFQGLGFQWNHDRYVAEHDGKFDWFPGTDASSPLTDDELPTMLSATLAAQHSTAPDAPIKLVRLRHYYKMSQGVVIAGDGMKTEQFVYDTADGRKVDESDPAFPTSFLPWGWRGHQLIKSFHRGDFLALPGLASGHVMYFLVGLAMLYLSISGFVLYAQRWNARRASGKKSLFWV